MTILVAYDTASILSLKLDHKFDKEFEGRTSPWRSIWISIFMQFIIGIQMSIYYMSTWPYLTEIDSNASFDFVGWVVASGSLGCSIANPLFGWWNQRTMSVTVPTVFGLVISCLGQVLYALLPLFSSGAKWVMVASRLTIGIGTGSIAVLRAYTAMAAVPNDKMTAIAYGTAGWVLGLSLGPVFQAAFTPVQDGWVLGGYKLDVYSMPPYFMVIVNLSSCLVMWFFFTETYSGIIDQQEQEENKVVIPKYDLPPALVCVWLWVCSCMISTNIEVLSQPLSTAIYNWNDSKSILYNGILESVTCIVSVFINWLMGYTRIGKIDKRKQIFFGIFVFLAYHICCYPWPFYPGPLQYIPQNETSATVGGCDPTYSWCADTVAVPLPVYIFSFVIFFGVAFPFIGSPSATLYTEILGPRPQGIMQGMYSFGGSVAQFIAPILSTYLFQYTGYQWIMLVQIGTLTIAFLLTLLFYKRLVPLELKPSAGKETKYDGGVFSAM